MISVSLLFWLDIGLEPHVLIAEDTLFQVRTNTQVIVLKPLM